MAARFTTSSLLRVALAIIGGALAGRLVGRLVAERSWWLPWILLAAFWLFLLYRHRGGHMGPPTHRDTVA